MRNLKSFCLLNPSWLSLTAIANFIWSGFKVLFVQVPYPVSSHNRKNKFLLVGMGNEISVDARKFILR